MLQNNSKKDINQDFQALIKKIAEMEDKENKVALLNLFKEFSHRIIFVPIKFSVDETRGKILKKPLVKWKNFTSDESKNILEEIIEKYKKKEFGVGIALRIDDLGVIAIDIDEMEIFEKSLYKKRDEILKDLEQDAYLIVKSIKRGIHVYLNFTLAKRLRDHLTQGITNNELRNLYGFEIKKQDLLVFPPSTLQYRDKLFECKILYVNPENFKKNEAGSETLKKMYELVDQLKVEKLRKETEKIEEKLKKDRKNFEELKKIIHEIKKRVNFEDLLSKCARSYSNYKMFNCPFHPPDVYPSFAVYKNEYEYATDFHDHKTYDIIAFYQKLHNCNFISALKDLAKIAGIEFPNAEVIKFQKNKIINQPYSIEELFISVVLNLLINENGNKSLIQNALRYLKNLPQDIFQDPELNELRFSILQTIEENKNKDLLYNKIRSKLVERKKINLERFTNLLLLPHFKNISLDPQFLNDLVEELLSNWKKRKLKHFQHLVATSKNLNFEKMQTILNEMIKVRDFSIFLNEQKKMEEELFHNAAEPSDFDIEIRYLYEEFLPRGTLNLWVAPPSHGKSALALILACWLLNHNKVSKVLYFDADNPIAVLKERKIGEILQRYKGRFLYFLIDNSKKFQDLVKKVKYVEDSILIIIDTLRAFAGFKDINKGEVAEEIMSFFKELCRSGEKTIIILHHVNKPPRDSKITYTLIDRVKGATEFVDRADLVYFLKKKKEDIEGIYLTLENIKARIPVRSKINFKVNIEEIKLEEMEEVLNEEEEIFVSNVLNTIDKYLQKEGKYPPKSYLEEALQKKGFKRNQIRKYLKRFDQKFWKQEKDCLFNRIVFKPLSSSKNIVANWQTGELKNDAVLEKGGKSKNCEELKNDGELRNSESSPSYHFEKTGKLASFLSSPVCRSKKTGGSLINSEFASLPASSLKDIPEDLRSYLYDKDCPLTLEQLKAIKEW